MDSLYISLIEIYYKNINLIFYQIIRKIVINLFFTNSLEFYYCKLILRRSLNSSKEVLFQY
ncbi:hypothetical protein B0H99_104213 [Planomicrobium soli]|uniref:Uncharacterized protein n=1 Tax=Planomicrobium soli TaxID=1176648 RepID=A0A2P8H3F7_9BACL|nr:hypothetical protein B0H99_104213 [Planomicrobium soli]